MIDEHDPTSDAGDLGASQERVVRMVLDRIAAAQLSASTARPPTIDVTAWAVPALIAASIVMVASGGTLVTTASRDRTGGSVIEWLGLPRPLAEYLETGAVIPSEWLNTYGSRP